MKPRDALTDVLLRELPSEPDSHMFWWHVAAAKKGLLTFFMQGLSTVVARLENVAPGHGVELVRRMAAVRGIDGGLTGDAFEALIQLCSEIYVVTGVAERCDSNTEGVRLLEIEPRANLQKNPELRGVVAGVPVAVEVKAPKLGIYRMQLKREQLLTRIPGYDLKRPELTLPRDNPMKDFLISAEAKFEAFEKTHPGHVHLLFVVWDDFVQEPVAALLTKMAGLFTPQSFYRNPKTNEPIKFPHVHGVVLSRYQCALKLTVPTYGYLPDGETFPFEWKNAGFPPKVLVTNPHAARMVPNELLDSLLIERIEGWQEAAEYIPADVVNWPWR